MARIFIAEDNQTQAIAIQAMPQHAGHAVRVVPDGDVALAAVRGALPEILLSDKHMPGRNGLEVSDDVRRSFRMFQWS